MENKVRLIPWRTAQTCGRLAALFLLKINTLNSQNMNLQKTCICGAAFAMMLGSVHAQYSSPATINGNGNTGFGGTVGNGNLVISDNGANLSFTLNSSGALGGNDLVIYIDSVAGGFSSTAGFQDAADGGRSAVSGYSSSGQSVLTFASGFAPEYALDIGNTYASLFGLANGGNNSLNYITGAAQSSASPYSLTVPLTDLGLTAGAGQSFELFGTLVSESGYRSTEAIAGNDSGTQGWNPFTQTSFATYTTVMTVPEPSTMVLGAGGMAMLLLLWRRR